MDNIEIQILEYMTTKDGVESVLKGEITPECFYLPKTKEAFIFAKSYYNSYRKSPSRALLKNKFDLDLGEPEESLAFLIDEIIERQRRNILQKGLIQAANVLTEKGSKPSLDVLQKIFFGNQKILIDEKREKNIAHNILERFQNYLKRENRKDYIEGAIFGWGALDNHILGMRSGELCVIFARPGKGKSLFATQIAINNWKRGKKILFLTYEMEIEQIENRIDCLLAGINPWRFEAGKLDPKEREKYKESLEKINKSRGIFIIAYPEDRGIEEVARQLQSHECDLLILDQLSFLEAEGEEGHLKVKKIVHDLDKVSKIYRVPILLITQGNRVGMEQKKAEMQQLHNIAFSDAVGQYASMVFTLFQTEEMLINKEMIIGLVKFRRGALASFIFEWNIDEAKINCLGYDGAEKNWFT